MRIAFVTTTGINRFFQSWPEHLLARALVRAGHEVRAYTYHDPGSPLLAERTETIGGIEVERVAADRYWRSPALTRALERAPRPDLLHVHHLRNALAPTAVRWARRAGVPVVFTPYGVLHNEFLTEDRDRPYQSRLTLERVIRGWPAYMLATLRNRRVVRNWHNFQMHAAMLAADRVVALSRHEAEFLPRLGVDPARIDTTALWTKLAPGGTSPLPEAGRPLVLYVGQLKVRKGFDLLARAIPAIQARFPEAAFVFVSHNLAGRAELDRLIGAARASARVHLLERVDEDEKAALFRAADVFVLPTRYEGFGLPILEAMVAECPVVTTDIPVVNEVVHDRENGLLVPLERPDLLARAVIEVLEDPTLRARLQRAGRKTALERYSEAALLPEMLASYARALTGPHAAGRSDATGGHGPSAVLRRPEPTAAVAPPPAPVEEARAAGDYFAGQESKSDLKVDWQYGRLLAFAGLGTDLRGHTVLDAGCGAAPGLRLLRARGARCVGADRSLHALSRARRLVPEAAVTCTHLEQPLPFAGGEFDVVMLSEVLEHVRGGLSLLRECYRVLRPGGVLVLTTPNLWDARRLVAALRGSVWSGHSDPTHVNLYTPARLQVELEIAGFEPVRLRTGFKPAFLWWPRRVPVRLAVPYPPRVGNGIIAAAWRPQ